jgi:hypothetical protein
MSNHEGFYPLSILEEKSNSVQFFASYRKEKSPIMMRGGDGYFITDENGKDLSIKKREYKEISSYTVFSKNFKAHWRNDFYKPYLDSSVEEIAKYNGLPSKSCSKKMGKFEYFYFVISSPYGCI